MKKMFALLLAFTLLAGNALAETAVTKTELNAKHVFLNSYTDTLYIQKERGSGYEVCDVNGNILSDSYDDINYKEFGFEYNGSEGNSHGFLDANGRVLIPGEYGDILVYSEKWQAGVVLVPATADNYDYSTYGSDKNFYLIDRIDFYYCGTKAGSLDRLAFRDYCNAYGDYLYVQDREGNWHYYDSAFHESGYQSKYSGGGEYDSMTSKGVTSYYHCGSGQQAFVASCTLTPDEVSQNVMEDRGVIYDLQGNVTGTADYYSVNRFRDGYAVVKSREGKSGIIDSKGKEIASCKYDSIDSYETALGYVSAVKDGKQGFISLTDGSEQGFVYSEAAVKVRAPFAYIQDLDGTYIVETAAAGVLEGRFKDVSFRTGSVSGVVQNLNGEVGVIGLKGEMLLDYDPQWDDTYDLGISASGCVVVAGKTVYAIDYDLSAVPAAEEAQEPGVWFCPNCGTKLDTKFCPNDGTAKPF